MMKDGLLAEYDPDISTTRSSSNGFPGDRLTWNRTSSRCRSEAWDTPRQLPQWQARFSTTRASIWPAAPNLRRRRPRGHLAAFDESTKRARGWMDKTDAELLARWSLYRGTQEISRCRASPRSEALC